MSITVYHHRRISKRALNREPIIPFGDIGTSSRPIQITFEPVDCMELINPLTGCYDSDLPPEKENPSRNRWRMEPSLSSSPQPTPSIVSDDKTELASPPVRVRVEERPDEPSCFLRIRNLSEMITEMMLYHRLIRYGAIERLYISRDRDRDMVSRGIAFVVYARMEDAVLARRCLQGAGWDHLLLQLDHMQLVPVERH